MSDSSMTRVRFLVSTAAVAALLGTAAVGLTAVHASAQQTKPSAGPAATSPLLEGDFVQKPSGLKYRELSEGEGAMVTPGSNARVHYTGWLTNGEKFDSSLDRDRPFTVRNVGRARVIKGWNEGLVGMKVGGKRRLVIPANLAYGSRARPSIPADSTLVFDIEVLEVETPPPPAPAMPFPDLTTLKLRPTGSGLRYADISVGDGTEVVEGSNAEMHYTGWLMDGTKFDSSLDRGATFPVRNVGQAGVIKGWNEGLQGMRQGGRRVLVIPPDLAYGKRGYPPIIPADSTLVFMIDAVRVTR